MTHEFGLTTFSPTGKLVQVEYALNAVSNGNTAIGIKAKNGVVIAVERKIISSLIVTKTTNRIEKITQQAGITYAGLGPDFRVLAAKGRKEAQAYKLKLHEEITIHSLSKSLATVMQEFTQSGGVRPFGVSLLLAGYDNNGPHLYQVDPSGTFWGWKATAIGKNATSAALFLEKRYKEEMELEDAIHTAILTLKDGFDGEMDARQIELGVIGEDQEFRRLTEDETKDYLEEVL